MCYYLNARLSGFRIAHLSHNQEVSLLNTANVRNVTAFLFVFAVFLLAVCEG